MIELDRLLAGDEPFALLHRPESTGSEWVELLTGPVGRLDRLAELPPSAGRPGRHEVLAVLPYRQLRERGFAHVEDEAGLLAMTIQQQRRLPLADLLAELPDQDIRLSDADFDLDDAEYGELVSRIVQDEIGRGEGSNFVLRRSFSAVVDNYSTALAASLFRRLLARESGAYWTFLVRTPWLTLVGASPERHLSLRDGLAVMNPISGTYRYPPDGPSLAGLLSFLRDDKESNELFMVLDEELKMMAPLCVGGGRVVGPALKQMSRLAHTEYFIEGRSELPVAELLHRTLFAPTVTGSPVESACRVIARHETSGRGYYSGALALIGTEDSGRPCLDSAILIRTAQFDHQGTLEIGVGSTIVRNSDPANEAAETRVKAAGLLTALSGVGATPAVPTEAPLAGLAGQPAVLDALARRNDGLADFWFRRTTVAPIEHEHRRVLVIDAEDSFTAMLEHQIRACGPEVVVQPVGAPLDLAGYDLVVLGPGPGDPRQLDDPKISRLHRHLRQLLAARVPILAICLGHQVVSTNVGLALARRPVPDQGIQRRFRLFERDVRVGFYSTFTACSAVDELWSPEFGQLRVSRDPDSGEVYGLHGRQLRSYQFHPESILSMDGVSILQDALTALLPEPAVSR